MNTRAAATRAASNAQSLQDTYNALHRILLAHVPPFLAGGTENAKPQLHLRVPKSVSIPGAYGGTPKHIALACVIFQRGYVGFYYLPLYLDPEIGKQLSPRLMKLLKGKTCFHIKQSDADLERDIESALEIGTRYFRDRKWI